MKTKKHTDTEPITPKAKKVVEVKFIKTFFDGKGREFQKDQIATLDKAYAEYCINNKKAVKI